MANEIDIALRSAATRVSQYVSDAAMLQVETKYVEIGGDGQLDFDKALPVARTIIKLDGDSESTIPMRRTEAGGLEMDATLFSLHQQNVTTAIEYRARILNALLSTLVPKGGAG